MMTDEQKKRFKYLAKQEYLTEEERDELDALLIIKKTDPDFNLDEWMNNN